MGDFRIQLGFDGHGDGMHGVDGQRVQAVGDEGILLAFLDDLFGWDLFCVTNVSLSQRRATPAPNPARYFAHQLTRYGTWVPSTKKGD